MTHTNGERISHFNIGGKTFFFNKRTARNNTGYLTINTLSSYGDQKHYEKLTLFPSQCTEFLEHLKNAMEEVSSQEALADPV